MEIKNIHSMRWATLDKSYVVLVADTNTGNNEEIATPYGEASIIWGAVKAYPVEQIAEYVEPVIVEKPAEDKI
jgi:hypothetical protein